MREQKSNPSHGHEPDTQSEGLGPLSNRRWLTPEMGREFASDLRKAAAMLQSAGLLLGLYGTARDHAILPETITGISALIKAAAERCPEIGILTGGGPGSMRIATEFGNQFAKAFAIKAGELSKEKVEQEYSGGVMVADHMMWTRRFLLTTLPIEVIGTPGGIGTMHEMIEHAFLQGRGLIRHAPTTCLDTPGGLYAALKTHISDKVLPYESAAMQKLFPDIWRVVDPLDSGSLEREGLNLTYRLLETITEANRTPGAPATPNARWFSPQVLAETQEDLSQVLALFDGTGKADLSGATLISLMGDLGRYGDHAAAVLKSLGVPNALLLTDDPRGRQIADLAGMPSFTLANDHDGTGHARGITVDGQHVSGTISHLVCAKRFVLTTAPSAILAYPGDLHTLDKLMEISVLHQVGLLRSQAIACVERGGYFRGITDFTKEHLEKGGYSNKGDLEILQQTDLDSAGSVDAAAKILRGA